MNEKPPILSDKEIAKALETLPIFRGMSLTAAIDNGDRVIVTTQRDADVAWCEDKIREIFEEIYNEMAWYWQTCDDGAEASRKWQSLKDKWLKEREDDKKD